MMHLVGDINILNMGDIEPRDYSNTILVGSDLEVLKMKYEILQPFVELLCFASLTAGDLGGLTIALI